MNFINRYHNRYHQDIISQKIENFCDINCSFEFFPPKNFIAEEKLWASITHLIKLKPSFFSVTYGANSGEREKTYEIVKKIHDKTNVITAPHLTCVDATPSELQKIAEHYWKNGVNSIVALRGDTQKKHQNHLMYAVDLVILLKKIANFDISVAAYPERHPESKDTESDIINLKKKIDAGANRAITQFFFNIDSYLRFRDNCIKYGITVEIVPGILPIYNFEQIQRFANMTNVHIPKWIFKKFHALDDYIDAQKIIGFSIVVDLVKKLSSEGVKNFHFYTLNQSDIVYSICHLLRLQNIS